MQGPDTRAQEDVRLDLLDHPIAFAIPRRLTNVPAWQEHIPFAMYLVDLLRPRVIVELGTHRGDSYCALCQAVDQLELTARCFAVDSWRGDPHAGEYGPEVLEELRAHHDPLYGRFSTLLQMSFDDALGEFEDGSIDLLHLDGCHTYEAAKHDFESWLPKLSERGVVMLHDTDHHGDDFGVWRLWAELAERHPHLHFRHSHGLGILLAGSAVPPAAARLGSLSDEERSELRAVFATIGAGHRSRAELEAVRAELEALNARAVAAEAQHAEVAQAQASLASRHVALGAEHAALQRVHDSVAAQHAALQSGFAALDARHRALEAEFAAAAERRSTLEAEAHALRAERETLLASRTFRWTAPGRRLMTRLRRRRAPAEVSPAVVRTGGTAPESGDAVSAADPSLAARAQLAARYLRGNGIEIGALHRPLALPPGAVARYVDRMSVAELRTHYPELGELDFVEPDVIDDGERLESFADGSLDFVIANHFLEHCENPLAAVQNQLRVLHPGGILYLTVPDKRVTFDRARPLTEPEHLLRDYEEGPDWSRRAHYEEWARLVDAKGADASEHAERLLEQGYSIHFHVWTPSSFVEFLDLCRRTLATRFEIEAFQQEEHEFVSILRRVAGSPLPGDEV